MTLYITQDRSLARDASGNVIPAGEEPSIGTTVMAVGATAQQSPPLDSSCRFIELHTDSVCHVEIGENPVATTGKRRLPAGVITFQGLGNNPDRLRISVIQGV
ncbi:MAG: hypothetical protein ACK503_09725 [Labrys sp. (in: a-proteobacteria)]